MIESNATLVEKREAVSTLIQEGLEATLSASLNSSTTISKEEKAVIQEKIVTQVLADILEIEEPEKVIAIS